MLACCGSMYSFEVHCIEHCTGVRYTVLGTVLESARGQGRALMEWLLEGREMDRKD